MAGVAAGLAASVKLTFLIPVVAIGLGVVVFSGRGRRLTTAWVLGLSTFVVGGYWYVRAAIKTGGNPIPQIGFGPLHLPPPDQMPLDPRPRFAVAHYLTDPTIYRKWFFPRLDDAFGPLWPLILIVAVAAAVFIAVRSRNRILQVIAAAALLTAVVYIFTPLTAAGQEGSPTGFFTNTRYLVPGLVLAMALLPIARPLRAPDSRAWQTLLFLIAVYAITVLTTPRWYPGYIVGTVFLTLALVWAPAALGLLRGRRRGRAAAYVAVGAGGGRCCSRSSSAARRRSSTTTTTTRTPTTSSRTAGRRRPTTSPAASTTSGSGSPARARSSSASTASTAPNLDNYVQYIGVAGPERRLAAADQLPAVPPPDQRRRLRLPDPQPVHDGRLPGPYQYPVYAWIKNDPAVKQLIEEPDIDPEPDYVFKVEGQARPGGCAERRRRLAQTAARACSRISSAERSGCSHQNMWPTSSRSSRRAPGSARAISSPLATLSSRSAVPWMTRVGIASSWRRALVSCAAQACICCMTTGRGRRQRARHLAEGGEAGVSSARKPGERLISHIARRTCSRSPEA